MSVATERERRGVVTVGPCKALLHGAPKDLRPALHELSLPY